MVFQGYALFPHMSVEQNIAFPLQVRKVPRETIARRVGEMIQREVRVSLVAFGPRDIVEGGSCFPRPSLFARHREQVMRRKTRRHPQIAVRRSQGIEALMLAADQYRRRRVGLQH